MTDRDRLIELLGLRLPINVRNVLGSYDTIGERTLAVDEREKLADYLLANGVILPPCKVGDVVYDICQIFDESTLKPKTVIKPRTIDFVTKVGFIIESKGLVIGEKDFGKTVFLTKEDAEEKLKELGK